MKTCLRHIIAGPTKIKRNKYLSHKILLPRKFLWLWYSILIMLILSLLLEIWHLKGNQPSSIQHQNPVPTNQLNQYYTSIYICTHLIARVNKSKLWCSKLRFVQDPTQKLTTTKYNLRQIDQPHPKWRWELRREGDKENTYKHIYCIYARIPHSQSWCCLQTVSHSLPWKNVFPIPTQAHTRTVNYTNKQDGSHRVSSCLGVYFGSGDQIQFFLFCRNQIQQQGGDDLSERRKSEREREREREREIDWSWKVK